MSDKIEDTDKPAPSGPGKPGPASSDDSSLGAAKAVKSKIERRVFWACIWSLIALALIVWSQIQPKPIPVIVAMSVGQAIGTLSLLLFLGSVALDIRSTYRIQRRGKVPAPTPSNPGGE